MFESCRKEHCQSYCALTLAAETNLTLTANATLPEHKLPHSSAKQQLLLPVVENNVSCLSSPWEEQYHSALNFEDTPAVPVSSVDFTASIPTRLVCKSEQQRLLELLSSRTMQFANTADPGITVEIHRHRSSPHRTTVLLAGNGRQSPLHPSFILHSLHLILTCGIEHRPVPIPPGEAPQQEPQRLLCSLVQLVWKREVECCLTFVLSNSRHRPTLQDRIHQSVCRASPLRSLKLCLPCGNIPGFIPCHDCIECVLYCPLQLPVHLPDMISRELVRACSSFACDLQGPRLSYVPCCLVLCLDRSLIQWTCLSDWLAQVPSSCARSPPALEPMRNTWCQPLWVHAGAASSAPVLWPAYHRQQQSLTSRNRLTQLLPALWPACYTCRQPLWAHRDASRTCFPQAQWPACSKSLIFHIRRLLLACLLGPMISVLSCDLAALHCLRFL